VIIVLLSKYFLRDYNIKKLNEIPTQRPFLDLSIPRILDKTNFRVLSSTRSIAAFWERFFTTTRVSFQDPMPINIGYFWLKRFYIQV
jgi:hypothetical protein